MAFESFVGGEVPLHLRLVVAEEQSRRKQQSDRIYEHCDPREHDCGRVIISVALHGHIGDEPPAVLEEIWTRGLGSANQRGGRCVL